MGQNNTFETYNHSGSKDAGLSQCGSDSGVLGTLNGYIMVSALEAHLHACRS
tara:strand:+ start:816 stop:971 length:156 start_codon:yes stop_codon:yes gene_type:complete